MRETLTKFVAEGPSATEREASVKSISGGFPLRIDSNDEVIEYLILIGFYGLPLDFLDTYVDRVRAVSLAEIGAASNAAWTPPTSSPSPSGRKASPRRAPPRRRSNRRPPAASLGNLKNKKQ